MSAASTDFEPWLTAWGLEPDGWPFGTPYTRSLLMPVRHEGHPAMLKVAQGKEEIRGAALMAWWDGDGAAPVLAHEPPAILLARAEDPDALPRMAFEGRDAEADVILAEVVARLHAHDGPPPDQLVPLRPWFRSLERRKGEADVFGRAWACVEPLLAEPQEVRVLHGDVGHQNVLHFGTQGWLAIDPKGLIGERGYDYTNIFRNPAIRLAKPERFRGQLARIAELADLEPSRLLRWAIGHGALSCAWYADDGGDPRRGFGFVQMALRELGA
jgi:streptomycin 6-kinase